MNYEMELWPNNKAARKAIFASLIVIAFGILLYAVSVIFEDQNGTYTTFRGNTRASGWPNTLRIISFYVIPAGLILMIIGFTRMNQKKSGYGLNREGVMLNCNGWTDRFFNWQEIASIEEINEGKRYGLILHMKDLEKSISIPPQKFNDYLRTQHIDRKKPIAISSDMIKGDASMFISQLKKYYSQGKS